MSTEFNAVNCAWRTTRAWPACGGSLDLYFPTRADIEGLKVGDVVPDCFGKPREVLAIHCRQEDEKGKLFVHYSTTLGEDRTCSVSNSAKEDRLERSVRASDLFTSAELDALEILARREAKGKETK